MVLETALALRHLADCEHRLRARADPQRAQHRRDMVLDGLDRDAELARDQLVRQPLQQQCQHLGLARRQADRVERAHALVRCRFRVIAQRPHDLRLGVDLVAARHALQPEHRRRHVQAAGHHQPQRLGQRVVGRPLGHEAHRAEVERADDVARALGRRDDDHRHRRPGRAQFGQHLEAVDLAQRQVEQHEVEAVVVAQRLARGLGGGHTDHGDIVAQPLDHAFERGQDQRMVVDQQHLHRSVPRAVAAAGTPPLRPRCPVWRRPAAQAPQPTRILRRVARAGVPPLVGVRRAVRGGAAARLQT